MIPFADLSKQYLSIKAEIDEAIGRVLREAAFIGGRYVQEFETAFAAYQRASHCVGVGNGTDAIEIVLEALELPQGSEVIVPANSFIATSEAVTRAGLKVVFCDCREDDYTINVDDARRRVTPRTKAIIAVHLYGHPCDMDAVLALGAERGLAVLEDCAQAHGAEYKGRRVGVLGVAGTFSFYPGKNLGAYGDAGAIVTQSKALADTCRMIANHGRIDKYDHLFEGRNSRLDALQAAVLSVKLLHLDAWTARRRSVADRYRKRLEGLEGIIAPPVSNWANPVWHLFVVRSARRDALKDFLTRRGVQTGIHYPTALPRLKAYAYLGQGSEQIFANHVDRELLSLPMGEHLEDAQVDEVCRAMESFAGASAPARS